VAKTEGARSTSGPPRVPAYVPGGRDSKIEQQLVRVRAASAGAVLSRTAEACARRRLRM